MKRSIWFRLFIGIMAFIVFVFTVMIALHNTYLEKYYLAEKKKAIYSLADKIAENYSGSIDDIESYILEGENKSIGSINIFDDKGVMLYTSSNTRQIIKTLPIYQPKYRKRIKDALESGNRIFFPYTNKYMESKSYVLLVPLNNSHHMIIISPLAHLEDSIAITNRFNYFIILVALITGLIFAFVFSRLFTKPIVELNSIAKRMIKLDFSKRYCIKNKDEIGQLGETINTLSSKLNTTINELNSANGQLKLDIIKEKKQEEQRKELISNISHELKTPIALIQGYGEGLQESVIANKEDKDYYCGVIIDEAQKMNKLVMELLELSHLESGHYKLNRAEFDIVSLTNNAISKYKDIIAKKGIDISIDTSSDVILLDADSYRLEQVIRNLLNNAIDHVNEHKKMNVTIKRQDDNILFELYNSGKQITKEESDNIWNSFYKADKARTRELGGTGLGLTITKGILNLHGYEYGLYNTDGGVTFWFKATS